MARGKNSLPGQRRQKIKLYRPVSIESQYGGGAKKLNYIRYASPWAQIFDERSVEVFEHDQRTTILTRKVQIRYAKNRVINGEDLAVFKGKTWRLVRPAQHDLNYGDYTNLYFTERQGEFTLIDPPTGALFNAAGDDSIYHEDFTDVFYTATGAN